ncbi:MAG: HAMP domain-containing histidine kinase [Desulfovibrio sp.]|nr:HAMP domain-containing histidine kinase [Desulfovibrio sp.]
MGLAGYYAHERMAVHLLAWHSRPVMNALIEAEQRAWRAQEHGRKHLYYGADLADAMHLRFLVGKEIPPAWKSLSPGLHFFDHDRFFVLLEEREGLTYALSGSSGLLQGLRDRLAWLLSACVLAGIVVAGILALVFSRRLTAGLLRLTMAVQANDGQSSAPLPQDLLLLHDEVGVLARALAEHENALQRFVRRESFFTGDVSHELRTPLTVMQGGLEVLEMRLAGLHGAESLMPVVERLQRTTGRMTETVGALLTLARRPEDIRLMPLDLSAYVEEMLTEYVRSGRICLHSPEKTALTAHGVVLLEALVSPHVCVLAHKALVHSVCKNLLDNACSYTDNGRAGLQLTPGCLEVRNSGAVAENTDIFARAVCGGQSLSSGTGIGLSLALRACEHLGWQLEHDTAVAGQSVFRVLFVTAPAQGGRR